MGTKRPHEAMEDLPSPFMPMFEQFRAELDEHHDRRERVSNASRNITVASKKIIFTLQRVRELNRPLPQHVVKGNKPYYETISTQFASVSRDLQGLNGDRYSRQISGGCQEYMEAASFQHYLETATLLSYDDAKRKMKELDVEGPGVELSPDDYILGVYDMTGELMRFAITAMAVSGALPVITPSSESDSTAMDTLSSAQNRSVLTDMRAVRAELEGLNTGTGPLAKDAEKKMDVMRASVEKVEKALYGLIVRGAERPKGWMPEMDEAGAGRAVKVEG